MMTKLSKQLFLNLLIVLMSFKSVYAQQDSSRKHQGHEESGSYENSEDYVNSKDSENYEGSEYYEVDDLDLKSGSTNQLFRMMMISFASSCCIMLLFFCLKIYCEYKVRNTPVIDLGPFEGLRNVSVSNLTVPQRKAIVAVLFPDEKCMTFHKKENEGSKEIEEKPKFDEECPPEDRSTLNVTDVPPGLPELSMTSDVENEIHRRFNRLKLPILKRRPAFAVLRNDSYEDVEDNEETKVEMKVECSFDPKLDTETKNVAKYKMTEKEEIYVSENDPEGGVCSICIDAYDEDDLIIKSKYCSHYFHKDCIMQWFDKSFCCPCCRVEMITADEVAMAISKINSEYGLEKKVQVQSEVNNTTPPASPRSSPSSISTPPLTMSP